MKPEDFAEKVFFDQATGGDPNKEVEVMVDPATIIMLTNITIKVVACLIERRRLKKENLSLEETKQVADIVKNPNLLDKITLRKVIVGAIGFRRYRKEGKSIFESLLRVGSGLTIGDIADLIYNS